MPAAHPMDEAKCLVTRRALPGRNLKDNGVPATEPAYQNGGNKQEYIDAAGYSRSKTTAADTI